MLGARTLHEASDKNSGKLDGNYFFLVEDLPAALRGAFPRRESPVDNLFLDGERTRSKSSSGNVFFSSRIDTSTCDSALPSSGRPAKSPNRSVTRNPACASSASSSAGKNFRCESLTTRVGP